MGQCSCTFMSLVVAREDSLNLCLFAFFGLPSSPGPWVQGPSCSWVVGLAFLEWVGLSASKEFSLEWGFQIEWGFQSRVVPCGGLWNGNFNPNRKLFS